MYDIKMFYHKQSAYSTSMRHTSCHMKLQPHLAWPNTRYNISYTADFFKRLINRMDIFIHHNYIHFIMMNN